MVKQNCRKWADVIRYKGNAVYLRHITEEEGLVVVAKTWTDSGVWAEPLKQSTIGSHSDSLMLKAQRRTRISEAVIHQ